METWKSPTGQVRWVLRLGDDGHVVSDHGQWLLGTHGTLVRSEWTGLRGYGLRVPCIWEASKPAKRKLNSPMSFFLYRKHKLLTM